MEIQASTGPRIVTQPHKLVWFNRQYFDKEKASNTKRIFCLGGSTTFGRPYADSTSYCGWMREILPSIDPTFDWEVINAGGVSYASYRVAAVMEELAQYDPDVFVVYCGHNEFLEERTYAGMRDVSQAWMNIQSAASNLRTFTLLQRWLVSRQEGSPREQRDILPVEVDERLNKTIGPADYHRDPEWFANVVRHYRFNLSRMVSIARRVGAAIVFVMPASNELDSDPFKSESGRLAEEDAEKCTGLIAEAINAKSEGDLLRAIEQLSAARDIDPLDPLIHYELGLCFFEAEQFEAAQAELRAAIDEDICPLRATSAITTALREVANEQDVPLIDFENLLRARSQAEYGHALLGNQFFLDHVHPNIEMHRELAVWILESLAANGLVRSFEVGDPSFQAELQASITRVEASIDQEQHGIALRNLAKVMHWAGKFGIAADRASDALDLIRNDAESRFVLADCLKNQGRPYEAVTQYEFLRQDHPDYYRAYLPYGELLMSIGQLEESADVLASASLVDSENPYLHLTIARLLMKQERWKDAIVELNTSLEMYGGQDEEVEFLLNDCQLHLADDQAAAMTE